ncbi:MAG: SMC-Scp complex subunit ScpB [Xanthomonadales bacterium]
MARIGDTARTSLKSILEGVLMASDEPLTLANLAAVFTDDERPPETDLHSALQELQADYAERGMELKEVASGWRIQVREDVNVWVTRLWEERPQRYSRALLETLALIAYRQPITRGDIEEVRGVSVRSSIIRTLQEREWIRVVGHRDVPGKPALFGTTRAFLDYFNLASLDDLPSLAEIRDMADLEPELDLDAHDAAGDEAPDGDALDHEAPDEDAADEDTADEDTADEDAPDEDTADEDTPDDDLSDDDLSDDDASDDDASDDEVTPERRP